MGSITPFWKSFPSLLFSKQTYELCTTEEVTNEIMSVFSKASMAITLIFFKAIRLLHKVMT
jgi:hypothetical protein